MENTTKKKKSTVWIIEQISYKRWIADRSVRNYRRLYTSTSFVQCVGRCLENKHLGSVVKVD